MNAVLSMEFILLACARITASLLVYEDRLQIEN